MEHVDTKKNHFGGKTMALMVVFSLIIGIQQSLFVSSQGLKNN
jgi:hypothetical protein